MLAQRLNELAQAHSRNLLTDEEYRILRQNAFESDLKSPVSVKPEQLTIPQSPTPVKLGFLPRLTRKASSFFSPTKPPSLNRASIPSFPPPKSTKSPSLPPPSPLASPLPPQTPLSPTLSTPLTHLLAYDPDDPHSTPPSSSALHALLQSTLAESDRILEHFDHLEDKARREHDMRRRNQTRLRARTPGDVSEVLAAGMGRGVWRDYSNPNSKGGEEDVQPASPVQIIPELSLSHSRSTSSLQTPLAHPYHQRRRSSLAPYDSYSYSPLPSPRSPLSPGSGTGPTSRKPPPSPTSPSHTHSTRLLLPNPPPSPSKSHTSSLRSLLRKASLSSIGSGSASRDHTFRSTSTSSKLSSSDRSSTGSRSKSGEYDLALAPGGGVKRSLSSSRSAGNLTSPTPSSNLSHREREKRGLGVVTEGCAASEDGGGKEGEEDEETRELRELRRKKEDVKRRYAERVEYLKAQVKSAELRERVRR